MWKYFRVILNNNLLRISKFHLTINRRIHSRILYLRFPHELTSCLGKQFSKYPHKYSSEFANRHCSSSRYNITAQHHPLIFLFENENMAKRERKYNITSSLVVNSYLYSSFSSSSSSNRSSHWRYHCTRISSVEISLPVVNRSL